MYMFLVTAISVFICAVYLSFQRRAKYWDRKKIPYLHPVPILGNFSDYILLKRNAGSVTQELCQKFPNEPYFGAFYGTEPALVVQDPNFIKIVTTQDYHFFSGREVSKYNDKENLLQNIFFAYGDKWKVLRQNLNPVFSTAKMKNMFYLIEKCSMVFEEALDQEVKASQNIEVRALMARFTMDCVGSCTFGVDANTQRHKEGNPFNDIGQIIFDTRTTRGLRIVIRAIWPKIFYLLGFRVFPKEVETFFYRLLTGIFEERQYKPSSRNDFVDLILKLWTNNEVDAENSPNVESDEVLKKPEINYSTLVSQCFGIFAAGYESSATTLGFTMYELAKNPEAQQKALADVDEYLRRNNNILKYECVAESPYLEACIDETLRKYPVLVVLTREVIEDYVFPNGLKLEKGIRVHIPVYHLHHNPDFFPEPEQYRPERFFGDEKKKVNPYTYMPFGQGPKICIGMRFAKMQMIAGLITVLKKYRLELAPGMADTVELEPKAIITQPVGGIRLKFIEREAWEQRTLRSAN